MLFNLFSPNRIYKKELLVQITETKCSLFETSKSQVLYTEFETVIWLHELQSLLTYVPPDPATNKYITFNEVWFVRFGSVFIIFNRRKSGHL